MSKKYKIDRSAVEKVSIRMDEAKKNDDPISLRQMFFELYPKIRKLMVDKEWNRTDIYRKFLTDEVRQVLKQTTFLVYCKQAEAMFNTSTHTTKGTMGSGPKAAPVAAPSQATKVVDFNNPPLGVTPKSYEDNAPPTRSYWQDKPTSSSLGEADSSKPKRAYKITEMDQFEKDMAERERREREEAERRKREEAEKANRPEEPMNPVLRAKMLGIYSPMRQPT